jgi:hypothetical protein
VDKIGIDNFTKPRPTGHGFRFGIDAAATAKTLRELADALEASGPGRAAAVGLQKATHITLLSGDDFAVERLTLTFYRRGESVLTADNVSEKLGIDIPEAKPEA